MVQTGWSCQDERPAAACSRAMTPRGGVTSLRRVGELGFGDTHGYMRLPSLR